MQQFIETNSNWIIPLLAWLIPTVLTPLFRKLPPQNILIVLRMLVGIFDKIQPQQFKTATVVAKDVADTKRAVEKATLVSLVFIAALSLTACGSAQVKPVVLTDSLGNVYPYAVVVTYQGVAVTTGFTLQATAQSYADAVAKDQTKTVMLISAQDATK